MEGAIEAGMPIGFLKGREMLAYLAAQQTQGSVGKSTSDAVVAMEDEPARDDAIVWGDPLRARRDGSDAVDEVMWEDAGLDLSQQGELDPIMVCPSSLNKEIQEMTFQPVREGPSVQRCTFPI